MKKGRAHLENNVRAMFSALAEVVLELLPVGIDEEKAAEKNHGIVLPTLEELKTSTAKVATKDPDITPPTLAGLTTAIDEMAERKRVGVTVVPIVVEKQKCTRIEYGLYENSAGESFTVEPSRSKDEKKARNFTFVSESTGVGGELSRYKLRKRIATGGFCLSVVPDKEVKIASGKVIVVKAPVVGTYLYPDATRVVITKVHGKSALLMDGTIEMTYLSFHKLVKEEDLIRVREAFYEKLLSRDTVVLAVREYGLESDSATMRIRQSMAGEADVTILKVGDDAAVYSSRITIDEVMGLVNKYCPSPVPVPKSAPPAPHKKKSLRVAGKTFVHRTTLGVVEFERDSTVGSRGSVIANGTRMYYEKAYKKYPGLGFEYLAITKTLDEIDMAFPNELYTFHTDKITAVLQSVGGKFTICYKGHDEVVAAVVTLQFDKLSEAIDMLSSLGIRLQ